MTSGLRDFAVALDGSVMTFECGRAQHRYTLDFSKEKNPSKRLSPTFLAKMRSYWSRQGGGCTSWKRDAKWPAGRKPLCPTCRREAKAKT
jgi:hypothetical protein